MPGDEERIRELIADGYYWDAIDLPPGAAADKTILRISDLMEEHPALGVELNRVQEALTQRRATYDRACDAADRIYKNAEGKYGPEALRFLRAQGAWRQIWDAAAGSGGSVSPGAIAGRLFKELEQAISHLPSPTPNGAREKPSAHRSSRGAPSATALLRSRAPSAGAQGRQNPYCPRSMTFELSRVAAHCSICPACAAWTRSLSIGFWVIRCESAAAPNAAEKGRSAATA